MMTLKVLSKAIARIILFFFLALCFVACSDAATPFAQTATTSPAPSAATGNATSPFAPTASPSLPSAALPTRSPIPTRTAAPGTPQPTIIGGEYQATLVQVAQNLSNALTYRFAIAQRIVVGDGTRNPPTQMDVRGSGEYAGETLHVRAQVEGSGNAETFDIYGFGGNIYYSTATQGVWRRVVGGASEPTATGTRTGAIFATPPFALTLNSLFDSGPISYSPADPTIQVAYTVTGGLPTPRPTPAVASATPGLAPLPPAIGLQAAQRYHISFDTQATPTLSLNQFGPDSYIPAILFARLVFTASGEPPLTMADATLWVEPGTGRALRLQSSLGWRDSSTSLTVETLMAYADYNAPGIAVSLPQSIAR